MLLDGSASDIVYTPAISGIPASFLRPSLVKAGLNPDALGAKPDIDLGEELDAGKAWRDIWSAGQGIGQIHDVPGAGELCERLRSEFVATCDKMGSF